VRGVFVEGGGWDVFRCEDFLDFGDGGGDCLGEVDYAWGCHF
jgi:hypothetical protein